MAKKTTNAPIDPEEALATQIPEYNAEARSASSVGTKLSRIPGGHAIDEESAEEFDRLTKGTALGGNIYENAAIRDGWIPVDRAYLGERSKFYPEDWQFYVRRATVEIIRNWSILDEKDGNSIDEAFNEILKYGLKVKTSTGYLPWSVINDWDRFFFVLLIREHTFVKGESNVEYYSVCPECQAKVKFTLNSQALMYDLPDESVMGYYNPDERSWTVDPNEFGIDTSKTIQFFNPTVDKNMAMKTWMIAEAEEDEKKVFDPVFLKFLPWMVSKISKDAKIASQQIKRAEVQFKQWNDEMFSFANDVLKNIAVTPSTDLLAVCENCGEEATSRMKFPDGIGALFNVVNRYKKFGTK